MWGSPISSSSLQLRRILLRCISSSTGSPSSPFPAAFIAPLRHFSSQPQNELSCQDLRDVAHGISEELSKNPGKESLPLTQRLDLGFGHIAPSKPLIRSTLKSSIEAGRGSLEFLKWLSSKPGFTVDDESLSYFVSFLGRRHDFSAIHEMLCDARGVAGAMCFQRFVKRLVRGGRIAYAVNLFERMEKDYGFVRDRDAYLHIIWSLCINGRGSHAERMVKDLANEFFPDDHICDLLIMGYCRSLRLDEARRLAGEMYRGGFKIGTLGYNAILGCVCKLCRYKNPFKLERYAEKVLMDMDSAGVPRNVATFNVLIYNLCKLRKTEEAMQLFHIMGERRCSPNGKTLLYLTRSLYKAGRTQEGDEMLDRLRRPGFEGTVDASLYVLCIRTLCSIERVGHALKIFSLMKKDGFMPWRRVYFFLMRKLVAHGRVSAANSLYDEAVRKGVPLTPQQFRLDPRFAKKKPRKEKPLTRFARIQKKKRTMIKLRALKKIRIKEWGRTFVRKPMRRRLM